MGDIFDSAIVGFLAVMGIDKAREGFQEPITYTPHLSGLIKISQMLVLQRAVMAVEEGETKYIQHRCSRLCRTCLWYMGAACRLTGLRNSGCMGRRSGTVPRVSAIIWSEDGQKLNYKDLELSMSGLKKFVQQQVEFAQDQLQQLLLIHAEEARADIVPMLRLQDLKDNPALNQLDQSLLTDPQNPSLKGYDRWLLNRVLKHSCLQAIETIIAL